MDGIAAPTETVEQMQARHRKEAKELQGRVTNKKKNATKKTRKGVNDECAEMERQMRERQAGELAGITSGHDVDDHHHTQQGKPEAEDSVDENGLGDTTDLVAAKMRAMGITELAAKPPQQPAPKPPEEGSSNSNGTAAGKKRNRQKERLARRAAEQEAAAEAAAQEAAGMTDHRGQERGRMTAEFARHGLEEHEIRPDGHCLFSAVADQLGLAGVSLLTPLSASGAGVSSGGGGAQTRGEEEEEEPGYKIVRRAAAGYIESRGDEFAGFLEEDLGSYVRKMRDTAEWGGQLELIALASVYGVEVCVVQDGRTEVIRPSGGGDGGDGDGEERKKIWLAYYRHGYGLGEHYNSLRRKS
ncbi:hypothetical protein DHEL01_v207860 [Diaporthe helianthi]|uniref:OTU domain-containing protein n=1 Tax=Diaporthe helianthi TaxID=158607 RepID=A0A2P5HU29_DIAHE|nr:hypothetical protein DHEL01_v207860 [Diaporthe helianthi]